MDVLTRSIFGVEEHEAKVNKRLTLGVATAGVGLVDLRASIINWRNCTSSIVLNTSSVALVNAEITEGPDVEVWIRVLGGVLSAELILVVEANAMGPSLWGSLSVKFSDNVVDRKRGSILLALTVERKVKNKMSAARLSRSVIWIPFPEEFRKPIPWRLSTWRKAWRTESTMRSASRSAAPVVIPKYFATVAVKSQKLTEGKERERENATKEKNSNHCFTIRFGADGWWDNRANR